MNALTQQHLNNLREIKRRKYYLIGKIISWSIVVILFVSILLSLDSCSVLSIPGGNKCAVKRGDNVDYICRTITTKKDIYISGFKEDAMVDDTVIVNYDGMCLPYFRKH